MLRIFPTASKGSKLLFRSAKVAELADAPDLGFRVACKQFSSQTL